MCARSATVRQDRLKAELRTFGVPPLGGLVLCMLAFWVVTNASYGQVYSVGTHRGPQFPVSVASEQSFGKMPDGTPVKEFYLQNANGLSARIISYGATMR